MTHEETKEWYAKKCNKTIEDFDEYDAFVAKVAYDYANEENKKLLEHINELEEQLNNSI